MLSLDQHAGIKYLWESTRTPGHLDTHTFILKVSEDRPIAMLAFYGFTGSSCEVTIFVEPGRIFPRDLLRAGMRYVWDQLGLKVLTFTIRTDNIRSIKLVEQLGAVCEATLQDTHPGAGSHIYSLRPANCKIWSRFNGQRHRSTQGAES